MHGDPGKMRADIDCPRMDGRIEKAAPGTELSPKRCEAAHEVGELGHGHAGRHPAQRMERVRAKIRQRTYAPDSQAWPAPATRHRQHKGNYCLTIFPILSNPLSASHHGYRILYATLHVLVCSEPSRPNIPNTGFSLTRPCVPRLVSQGSRPLFASPSDSSARLQ